MKLKTYHHIWQNRYWTKLLLCLFISFSSFAQSDVPGVLESFEKLIGSNRNKFVITKQKKNLEVSSLSSIPNISDIVIDPFFMRTLLFRSEKKYLKLLKDDFCSLASLISNDLLYAFERPLENILVIVKNSNGKNQTLLVPKQEFLDEIYKRKCPTNKEMDTLYSLKNIKKTVDGLELTVPKTKKNCQSIFDSWTNNLNTPYLCRIPETIELAARATKILNSNENLEFSTIRKYRGIVLLAKNYKDNIPLFKRSYLKNLCDGLEKVENFCSNYLAEDAWTKIINGELPNSYLSYKCKNILGKENVNTKDLEKCGDLFNKTPKVCLAKGNEGLPSYFPLRKCDSISEALNISNLKTDYHDCPGNVDNEAIINVHRIIMHIKPSPQVSSSVSCINETHKSFAHLAMKYNKDEIWPLKICYYNPLKEIETCDAYIPGQSFEAPDSENNVIASILTKKEGAPDKMKCELVDSNTYNPLRLKFQVGCYIVYEANKCTNAHCPKKIIWNKKEVEGIQYKGIPRFSYFPSNLKDYGNSVEKILERTLKVKNKPLKNLTEITFFLDKSSNNIAHGVGCLEDILPQNFQKSFFNGCRPLPFIVDGYKKKGKDTLFSIRLPIDDIHSPRLINWNRVFNAVTNYKKIHPMDPWTFNGIVKAN